MTSVETHNLFVEQVQEFKDDMLPLLEDMGEAVAENAHENVIEAKRDSDDAKMERAIVARHKAEESIKGLKELEGKSFDRAPEGTFDWGALIQMVMSALGVGGLAAPFLAMKNSKIRKKAVEFAKSTEVNDTSDLT